MNYTNLIMTTSNLTFELQAIWPQKWILLQKKPRIFFFFFRICVTVPMLSVIWNARHSVNIGPIDPIFFLIDSMFGVESISVAKSFLGGAGWRVNDYLTRKVACFEMLAVRLILVGGQNKNFFSHTNFDHGRKFSPNFFPYEPAFGRYTQFKVNATLRYLKKKKKMLYMHHVFLKKKVF